MFGTKKKLMAAVVMLVISAIMMTSASYAWFTISTNPEIKGMTTQVVTNENLEIALSLTDHSEPVATAINQSGNQYTWGNIVDLTDPELILDDDPTDGGVYDENDGAYRRLDKTLRPATLVVADDAFYAPEYGTDGRIDGALVQLDTVTVPEGFGQLVNDQGDADATNDVVYGYYVDYWLRSNVDGDVTLGVAAKRSSDGEMGGGTVLTSTDNNILNNVKIAFQPGAAGDINLATATVTAGVSTAYTTPVTPVVTLVANTAQLVRMYVYYEGAALTNADAIIGDALVNAGLNVQFTMTVADVDTSMDNY